MVERMHRMLKFPHFNLWYLQLKGSHVAGLGKDPLHEIRDLLPLNGTGLD